VKKRKIIFVCAANVCRSVMAEGLFKELVHQDVEINSDGFEVGSAGTYALNGSEAGDQTLEVLRERGLDMSRHRSQAVSPRLIDWADLVLCMEKAHLDYLRLTFPAAPGKLFLLTEYCGLQGDIVDPSSRPTAAFRECAAQLEGLLNTLLNVVK
jgi:protein-tyrosine-phosphatase